MVTPLSMVVVTNPFDSTCNLQARVMKMRLRGRDKALVNLVENVEGDHMVRGQDAEINQHEDQGREITLKSLLNQFG